MLFLDKDLQIAENDSHIYNKSLVSPIVDSNGRVAILGGGDGGVLSEVTARSDGTVVLIDIDSDVVEASKELLPSIHRGAFDKPNVEVRIEDANVFLETERGFDAIIYDLTMHPEALTCAERKTFLSGIFSKIRNSLVPGGVVSMQCCSQFDTETREMLSDILRPFFGDLEFTTSFIPSFCERWLFATARAKVPAAELEGASAGRPHPVTR